MDYKEISEELCRLHLEHARALAHLKELSSVQGEEGVLIWLSMQEGPTYSVDAARHFGLSAGRVANIVHRLESKGFIERQVDDEDQRRARIIVSGSGARHAADQYRQMEEELEVVLESLGDEDATALLDLVKRFLDAANSVQ